jgi:HJR/Mrr/RecB family endonuclease
MAGKQYDRADTAIVVSNQRYTPAAESMATTGGVLLLHHSDLPSLDRLLM